MMTTILLAEETIGLVTSAFSALTAFAAWRKAHQIERKVSEIHISLNGRLDQLLEMAKTTARLEAELSHRPPP